MGGGGICVSVCRRLCVAWYTPGTRDHHLASALKRPPEQEIPLTEIARLHDLQRIDTNTEKANRHLQQLKKALAEPVVVQQARASAEASAKALAEWTRKQRELEGESQTLLGRIATSEAKLMGGSVRNPKELEDLQQSIAAMRRQLTGIEESAVEALLQVEEAEKQQGKDAATLASLESQWAVKEQELLAEESKTKRIVLQLRTNRSKVLESISAADVQLYEDLRKRRAGIAVATIVNGQCSACNVKVPTGVVSAAHSPSTPAYCTSCGRILVLQ